MFQKLSIKSKTLIMVVGIILIISSFLSILSINSIYTFSKKQIEEFKKNEYLAKEKELKNYVNIVTDIIREYDSRDGKDGQEKAKKDISKIRFGDSGYFWIHDLDLKMIMHSAKPSLNGKSISEVKDPNGKFLFQEMNQVVKSKGEGRVSYMWPKPNEEKPKEKFSHVKLYEPWGWVIGTGLYVDNVEKTVRNMELQSSENINNIIYQTIGLTLLVIILSYFLVAAAFNILIYKPLSIFKKYFQDFLLFITMETNRYEKAQITSSDEISELLIVINNASDEFDEKLKNDMRVIGEIVLTADKMEQGIYKCRINSNSDNPMVVTLKHTLNKMLETVDKNMHELIRILSQYAEDDFREKVNISPRLQSEMLKVMESINKLGETLSTTARDNLSNGQTLENNSHSMTESMNNLASKANEQAASLEETAAAVEEITSITRANAENAVKMAELGQTVKSSVGVGQELASKTAISMDEINEKVTSINEAITVIDQIAFQTNILSLNAAVEAATAGEAGKGFAVVAQEVRNLAARSAEAAKEIKNLVEDANIKANEGKTISGNMIKGYKELNSHITETIHIIEDVSSSSKEQMTGIEQINDAVTMLDRVTQENASEANQVKNIANDVADIAHKLVADAKSKKFN